MFRCYKKSIKLNQLLYKFLTNKGIEIIPYTCTIESNIT